MKKERDEEKERGRRREIWSETAGKRSGRRRVIKRKRERE